MPRKIVTLCKRKYVIGRWNPAKEKCEYLTCRGSWDTSIDHARTHWNNHANADLHQYGSNHMPVFICKVFVTSRRNYWGGGIETITPTKLNYWQQLEGILQI